MDPFFRITSEDIKLEMLDDSEFIEREKALLEDAKAEKNGDNGKKVTFEKIKQDNLKLKEKFEGLASYFKKASTEDIKKTDPEDIAEKVLIRKEAIDAMRTFNKFDSEIIQFINRMTDCIYERTVTKEDFLKMSDRQYRDLRQKIDYDTDHLRELCRYSEHTKDKSKFITITKEQAYKYSLEMDRKYEDTMRKLSREVEETYSRKLKLNIVVGILMGLAGIATLGVGLLIGAPIYYYFYAGYWFKALRTVTQVEKFRRNYKERYNFIKLLLKG